MVENFTPMPRSSAAKSSTFSISALKRSGMTNWFNVTGGYDAEWDWFSSHEHFTRRGWAWVGVSAQYVGATALRQFNSSRYGSINHPGDSFAADGHDRASVRLAGL